MELQRITKKYGDIVVNKDISLNLEMGKFYVIRGHSGAGKTTLLNIMGLLDVPTQGKVLLDNQEVNKLPERDKADMRMKNIGFIFQEFYLNEALKAYENVMIPMIINPSLHKTDIKAKSCGILDELGLGQRVHHYPGELSGGEKQRVAIGRALANDPRYLLADEPTGNLDRKNEVKILEILKNIAEREKTVVVVTHSEGVLEYADHVYMMDEGSLMSYGTEI
ncbi:MAG: ABC transporter ATP-binding protein [Peptococcaceae bacterium]|nr:ABC transporter ATP-binding protein [Peptococcaceae bacterium]